MWTHKSIKKLLYVGNYEYNKEGKRVFRLEHREHNKTKGKVYMFTSPQAARKAGWKFKEKSCA